MRPDSTMSDPEFLDLIAARWSEYRAERYLQDSADSVASTFKKDEIRANTPAQLFLVYNRVTRARLELKVYSKLLKAVRPTLLKGIYYALLISLTFLIVYAIRI